MSEEHLTQLREARQQLVERRRTVTKRIANPERGGGLPEDQEANLIRIQSAIDAIDEAIVDEQRQQPSVFDQLESSPRKKPSANEDD